MNKRIMTWLAGLALLGFGGSLNELWGQEKRALVEGGAIKCWWKTDRNAVQFGQLFHLTLTCQLANSSSRQTTVEEGLLEGGLGSKMAPFEVVGIHKYQDLPGESVRFEQYQYTLRLMTAGLWGKDAAISSLEIKYRVRYAVKEGEMVEGQPQIYVMPVYPIRILSLVPKEAKDIRDAGLDNFGYREKVAVRGKFVLISAATVGGLAILIFLWLVLGLIRHLLGKKPVVNDFFSRRVLLRRLPREWKKIQKIRAKQGWNADLLIRAITILRIAGAVSLGRLVLQVAAQVEERGLEGQLKLRQGLLWPKKILVSSSLTPEEMRRVIKGSDKYGETLMELNKLLNQLSQIRYSSEQYIHPVDLDNLLIHGAAILVLVRYYNCWLIKKSFLAKERCATWWRRLWIRS